MNPRLAATTAMCREVAIPALVLTLIAASGVVGIDRTGAAPSVDHLARSLAADAKFADNIQPDRAVNVAVDKNLPPAKAVVVDNIMTLDEPLTQLATADATPAAPDPAPVVVAALTSSAETLPAETAPAQDDTTSITASIAPQAPGEADQAASSPEALDKCSVDDSCVDHYLWALYQHTPKEDAVTTHEQRKVAVKRKGKLVTVTRTFTTVGDEDFSWKDPKAADKAGMSLADYVIGGMDRDFKVRLFHMLHVAEQAGLSPGITSAFRDDYRQSIASGLKAANDRSYHGGSTRGGYGHGLAADIVSVNGATRADRLIASDILWKWVDTHGKDFGIGRPYLGRDPPHVAPIDGKEYADHHPGMKARQAGSAARPGKKLALGNEHSPAKRARTARSS